MTTDADIIVVGGGPIGLAASIEARLAGLSVVLVEHHDGSLDKACGEGLMPGALPLLARLGVDPPGMPILGVSYRQGSVRADHRFASGPGRGVRRLALHNALHSRAVSLGVQFVSERATSVTQDAAGVTVAGVRASWLLASDGLHSTVRSEVGLAVPTNSRSRRFGLRQHFAIEPWSDLIEVHWAPQVEIYVTPVSALETGIAVLGPRGTQFADALASVPEIAARLRGAEPSSSLRGAGPFRQRASAPHAGRVLLVGDASGYVDAITGEGLRLGFAQARAAVASVAAGHPESYDAEWQRITRDFRRLTGALVGAAQSPARRMIVPAARALPGLFGAVVEKLAE